MGPCTKISKFSSFSTLMMTYKEKNIEHLMEVMIEC